MNKSQLKQIIKEELEEGGYAGHYIRDEDDPDGVLARFNHREKVLKSIQALDFLKMKARDYHNDPTLNPGDIKALLQDDFMDSQYPKFFGIDEGEPSVADFIEQYAVGQELNEVKKMKITKAQLKQIIKEELEAVVETAQFEGGPEVDIRDAIQMLEAEESRQEGWPEDYQTGQLYYVINRLHEALAKLGGPSQVAEGNFEGAYRAEIEADARDAGISEEEMEGMTDDELIAAIHRAMSLR